MNSYLALAVACPDYFTHKTPVQTSAKSHESKDQKYPTSAPKDCNLELGKA